LFVPEAPEGSTSGAFFVHAPNRLIINRVVEMVFVGKQVTLLAPACINKYTVH